MVSSFGRKDPAVLLGVLLVGISVPACSRRADRPRSTESTSSATLPDTATAPVAAAASSTEKAATAQDTGTRNPPKQTRPLPRPSIDPGRMPPRSQDSTARTAKPADSTAAAGNRSNANPSQDQNLKYDAANNTVTFELIGGPKGFQFNGFASGGATLTLPPKATVVINFVNKDGTPHSAEVISGDGPLPNSSVDAAIPKAYTNQLLQGLPQEGTDVIRFQAPESGSYRIICGVPGHALSGMWIWMKVDASAKTPSFGPTKT
jgi:sulfocyanin